MARPLRIQFPGAVYHVMNRGTARQATFVEGQDYAAFLTTLDEASDLWGIEVFAYCLMRNHYHVCLRTPKGNLSRVMRHIDGLYTQRFNRTRGRDGPLFRGRYKAIVVDADEYLNAVVRYIHLNPVGAAVVQMPQDYLWSSHRFYLQQKGKPNWLKVSEVLEQFGTATAFQEFVLSGNEAELERFYNAGRQSPVLGGEKFLDRVRGRVGRLTREHPRHERVKIEARPGEVLDRVARYYRLEVEELLRGGRGKQSQARKVAMYLVRRCCDQTLQETAKLFNVGSYGAVGWACHEVRLRMQKEHRFSDQINTVAEGIYQQKT